MARKTYQETKYGTSFNWGKELRKKNKSDQDWFELKRRSRGWVTCACGNQCAILPRDTIGSPKDIILRSLGVDFANAVHKMNVPGALRVLKKIEARSTLLLATMDFQSLDKKYKKTQAEELKAKAVWALAAGKNDTARSKSNAAIASLSSARKQAEQLGVL